MLPAGPRSPAALGGSSRPSSTSCLWTLAVASSFWWCVLGRCGSDGRDAATTDLIETALAALLVGAGIAHHLQKDLPRRLGDGIDNRTRSLVELLRALLVRLLDFALDHLVDAQRETLPVEKRGHLSSCSVVGCCH